MVFSSSLLCAIKWITLAMMLKSMEGMLIILWKVSSEMVSRHSQMGITTVLIAPVPPERTETATAAATRMTREAQQQVMRKEQKDTRAIMN